MQKIQHIVTKIKPSNTESYSSTSKKRNTRHTAPSPVERPIYSTQEQAVSERSRTSDCKADDDSCLGDWKESRRGSGVVTRDSTSASKKKRPLPSLVNTADDRASGDKELVIVDIATDDAKPSKLSDDENELFLKDSRKLTDEVDVLLSSETKRRRAR